jgi:hypothetical protein
MGLNGGLKVRDLGFKPPTGDRACPICRERPVSLESRKDTEPDRGANVARLP